MAHHADIGVVEQAAGARPFEPGRRGACATSEASRRRQRDSASHLPPLPAADLDFAHAVFNAFGEDRFTLYALYRWVYRGSGRCASLEDVAALRNIIALRSAALADAPGIRGDEGWRLSERALQAARLWARPALGSAWWSKVAALYRAFGGRRFTVQDYYRGIMRGAAGGPSAEDQASIAKAVAALGTAVVAAVDQHGRPGWRLAPGTIAALLRTSSRQARLTLDA